MLSKTKTMSLFIRDFCILRSAKQAERLERMATFLTKFEETYWQSPGLYDFNIFSLLNIQGDEVKHSRFLAWLMDTKASHRQNSRFFQAFLELCGIDLSPEAFTRYHVQTEFVGEESTIDITAHRKEEFLVYLENKVFASERPNQIDREFRDMRRRGLALRIPENRQFAIFLTPTGHSPISGDATYWHTISYTQIATSFRNLLPNITSDKVRIILHDWLDTISTFGRL